MNIIISGTKYFGEEVLREALNQGHKVKAVVCPLDDNYIGKLARLNEIPIIDSNAFNADLTPDNIDLGISAHSFNYIGKATRYKAKYGWIGYHPSLLPRHRGRSSIEWTLRMKDPIAGGTVFWLNQGIDRGDIAYQDFCMVDPAYFLDPKKGARNLWREELLPMGLRLISKALKDISKGVIIKEPQDARFSTWEPDTKVNDIYRPDALLLNQQN